MFAFVLMMNTIKDISPSQLSLLALVMILLSCSQMTEVRELNRAGILYRSYNIDQDSLIQGELITYFDNGIDIFEQANYVDNQIHGLRTLYFANQKTEIIEHYDHGTLVDTLKVYYSTGQLRRTEYYDRGVVRGEVITYFKNGRVKESVRYDDNLENGPFTEYYKNGHIKWEGTFVNGDNEVGALFKYDSTGQLIRKLICDSLSICKTTWTLQAAEMEDSNG